MAAHEQLMHPPGTSPRHGKRRTKDEKVARRPIILHCQIHNI